MAEPRQHPQNIHSGADTSPGITTPFGHTVAGMHLGSTSVRPVEGEFDAILTLAKEPGFTPDLTRHRHIPISYFMIDPDALGDAVEWAMHQVKAERKILIRSEKGLQRPGLVIGAVVIDLGGTVYDAIASVRNGHPNALTDFRYINLLRTLGEQMDVRRRHRP